MTMLSTLVVLPTVLYSNSMGGLFRCFKEFLVRSPSVSLLLMIANSSLTLVGLRSFLEKSVDNSVLVIVEELLTWKPTTET